VPAGKSKVGGLSTAERLRLFRAATERQQAREKARPTERVDGGRGWTREELYTRAKPR
jgi:hypothetical protein